MTHTESRTQPQDCGTRYELKELMEEALRLAEEKNLEIVLRFRRETPSAQRLVIYVADILQASAELAAKEAVVPIKKE